MAPQGRRGRLVAFSGLIVVAGLGAWGAVRFAEARAELARARDLLLAGEPERASVLFARAQRVPGLRVQAASGLALARAFKGGGPAPALPRESAQDLPAEPLLRLAATRHTGGPALHAVATALRARGERLAGLFLAALELDAGQDARAAERVAQDPAAFDGRGLGREIRAVLDRRASGSHDGGPRPRGPAPGHPGRRATARPGGGRRRGPRTRGRARGRRHDEPGRGGAPDPRPRAVAGRQGRPRERPRQHRSPRRAYRRRAGRGQRLAHAGKRRDPGLRRPTGTRVHFQGRDRRRRPARGHRPRRIPETSRVPWRRAHRSTARCGAAPRPAPWQGLDHALATSCNMAFAHLGLGVGRAALLDELAGGGSAATLRPGRRRAASSRRPATRASSPTSPSASRPPTSHRSTAPSWPR